ncbi:MAG: methionyl-tRNA formyltransferase [Betaproteobacteria bacterium]
MRIAFAGTPVFAAIALQNLIDAKFDIALVLTQPDRPAGRGLQESASAVKQLALRQKLAIAQPPHLRNDDLPASLRASGAHALVVAAYGLILPAAVLYAFPFGCINIHASLLPRWRGAAPIQRAILAGDRETGISIMHMEQGLDTGPVYFSRTIELLAEDSAASLHDKLAELGGRCIVEALPRIERGELTASPQSGTGITYANKIIKAEAEIDWKRDALDVDRAVRAFNPFPGAFSRLGGEPVKVWRGHTGAGSGGTPGEVLRCTADSLEVACGSGIFNVTELQKAGGKRLSIASFLRGTTLPTGARFGT